jgi:hypothetical protein
MEFSIIPNSEKSEVISVGKQEVLIKLIPFQSKIKVLKFCYDNQKGYLGSIPIRKTHIRFQAHVKGGDVWFEYKSSDKIYTIELEIIDSVMNFENKKTRLRYRV